MRKVVEHMCNRAGTKYVGMNQASNLLYRDHICEKYAEFYNEYKEMILRPKELCVERSEIDDALESRNLSLAAHSKTHARAKNYSSSQAMHVENEWRAQNSQCNKPNHIQMTLSPLLFWFDATHVCDVKHYRDLISSSKVRIKRGSFLETRISLALRKSVNENGFREAHPDFGCYLLDEHTGYVFTRHIDGRKHLTEEQKREAKRKNHDH